MAKRSDLSSKLSKSQAPGWRDMIPLTEQPDSKKSRTSKSKKSDSKSKKATTNGGDDKKVRKTYYLRPTTIERIQGLADQERVGISDFVEYALTRFLDMLDEGDIEMETKSKEVREIIY